jgi:hypothetical protein
MSGSIRALVGFLMVFGSAGGVDTATDSELLLIAGIVSAGFMLMVSGINAMKEVK